MTESLFPEPSPFPDLAGLRARLPADVRFGTSSWTYPGWTGQVYHRRYPAKGAAARMLAEYAQFPLFTTVGIDSTFYRPASEATLTAYARHLPPGFPCCSKVWDQITVHTHSNRRQPALGGEANPDFLNVDLFMGEVLEPMRHHFADHLGPLIFEFQAIPETAGLEAQAFADRLDGFLARLPRDVPYAVEIRNPEYLAPPYFAVLREHGAAHVFNSWTRMPPIGTQLDLPDALTAPFVLTRALLRPGRYYQDAVELFQPYDRIRDPNPELRRDLVRLIETAVRARIPAYVLVNNRAEGSAPHTIAAVAEMTAARLSSAR